MPLSDPRTWRFGRYDTHDWKRNWKGLVVGLLAGTLVAWLFWGVPDASAREDSGTTSSSTSYRDCWDMYHCNTPREHARAFADGAYGWVRASADVNYTRAARRRLLRKARIAYNNRGLDERHGLWDNGEQWRDFIGRDNCISTGYPTNMYHCKIQQSEQFWRKERRWRGRIAFCGAGMVPAVFTGGAWVWIGYGGAHCLWGFALD